MLALNAPLLLGFASPPMEDGPILNRPFNPMGSGGALTPAQIATQLAATPGVIDVYMKGVGQTIATGIAAWTSQGSGAHTLSQGTGANQPAVTAALTALFNGTSHFLKTSAFTLNQPAGFFFRYRQVTWTNNDYIMDGDGINSAAVSQLSGTPNLQIMSGIGFVATNGNLAVNAWGSEVFYFNGASSLIQVSGFSSTTGNPGTTNPGGFTMGAVGNGILPSNIEVAAAVITNTALAAGDISTIFALLDLLANTGT